MGEGTSISLIFDDMSGRIMVPKMQKAISNSRGTLGKLPASWNMFEDSIIRMEE